MAIKNFKPMECPVCHEYYFTDDTELDTELKDEEIFVLFGKETKGLPETLLAENKETCMRIPMVKLERARSLNLSNSVAIVVYEALRQIGYPDMR